MSTFDRNRTKDSWEKLCTSKQTNRQTNRHYENNGHLAVNQFLGHVACTAVIHKPPSDWKWPSRRHYHIHVIATESDPRSLNFGPSYVWNKGTSWEHWPLWTRPCSGRTGHEYSDPLFDQTFLQCAYDSYTRYVYIAQVNKTERLYTRWRANVFTTRHLYRPIRL